MTKYPINIKLHALNTAFPVYVHTIFLLAFFFLSRAVLLLHFFFLFLAQFRRRPALPSSLPPQSPFGVGGGKCMHAIALSMHPETTNSLLLWGGKRVN